MSLANPSLNLMSTKESHLDRIRELTDKLSVPEGVVHAPGLKQYETITGKMLAWTIHWQEEYAICHAFLSANSRMQRHAHEQKEWIIVISGELKIITNNEETIVKPRHEIVLDPHQGHEVAADVDTYVLAITMSAAWDWPRRLGW